ncbi:3062_t:CDS:2, partial [Scutellospora calospora]
MSNQINKIVEDLCKIYDEEATKGKTTKLIFDIIDQFLIKNYQASENIVNWYNAIFNESEDIHPYESRFISNNVLDSVQLRIAMESQDNINILMHE